MFLLSPPTLCAAILLCYVLFEGGRKGKRKKKDAGQVCLTQGEERCNLSSGMCGSTGKKKLENGCTELNYVAKEKILSVWSEYHLLFCIFRLAKRTILLFCAVNPKILDLFVRTGSMPSFLC